MSLDLSKVAAQIDTMVARLRDERRENQNRIDLAFTTLQQQTDFEALKQKIASSHATWLVADPVEKPEGRFPLPKPPEEFTVISTDGSNIDVDRHRPTRCYLINIGSVVLRYGAQPDARLENHPTLCSRDDELIMAQPGRRDQTVEGPLLGVKRMVDECHEAAAVAGSLPPGGAYLALLDGSLILWSLEGYPEFVSKTLLEKGLLTSLEEMRKLNSDRQLALASYISYPRSTDVVNMLRVAICPDSPANCDHCSSGDTRACDVVARVVDRQLFTRLLEPGERSALFISTSQVQKYYQGHRVHFFYLRVEDEIARVEVPEWVARDKALLDLTHALLVDQCHRGQGYPVALSEAHEQAVVTGADREYFWQLVDSSLVDERLPTLTSAKSMSKRMRWV